MEIPNQSPEFPTDELFGLHHSVTIRVNPFNELTTVIFDPRGYQDALIEDYLSGTKAIADKSAENFEIDAEVGPWVSFDRQRVGRLLALTEAIWTPERLVKAAQRDPSKGVELISHPSFVLLPGLVHNVAGINLDDVVRDMQSGTEFSQRILEYPKLTSHQKETILSHRRQAHKALRGLL